MPFSSTICDEIKCCNVIDSYDMQQGGESVSLQDFEYVSTPIFIVAYNLNEKRDQMFGLRDDLEKKYITSASLSVIDESVQKQIEHVPPDQWLQHDVPCLKKLSTCTTPSTVVCEKSLDRDAEIKCANMHHEVQIEGITDINNSTEIDGVPLPLELVKVGCSTWTFVGQCLVEEFTKESDRVVAAQNIAMKALRQNPCEIESHIDKLSAKESKSELCDSTKCEIESIHNECEGYTPHKKTELDYKISKDIYDSNPLIPTSCVVSQSVQVSEETEKEVISHHTIPLVEIGENIIVVQNQFVAPINMNHEDEGGKNSEVQPIVYIQTSKLKSNENNSNLNLQGTLLSNHDKTSAANLVDLTQRFNVDSNHLKVNSCA
jgi:hypothetical protein